MWTNGKPREVGQEVYGTGIGHCLGMMSILQQRLRASAAASALFGDKASAVGFCSRVAAADNALHAAVASRQITAILHKRLK